MTKSTNGAPGSSRTGRPPKGLRFRHVTLANWRNFRAVDVNLERRVIVVGPNASGKSNFLDAFRFLRDISRTGGGFQAAVEARGGVSRLRCLAARRYPEVGITVDLGLDEGSRLWRYELRFTQDNQRRPIVTHERVEGSGFVLQRPDGDDEADRERLTQTAIEQVTANKDFRQIAEFFDSVRYLHVVPQLIREPERSMGRPQDPFGGDFLERVASTPSKTRTVRLERITAALRVAVPQLSELELFQRTRGTWHIRGRYQHWRPQGAWQDEADFSDGTLRLLGVLWSILDGSGPLLLEEPELSLHTEVVRYVPQMLARVQRRGGRQILLSTHSHDMLRDDGLGLYEVLVLQPGEQGTSVAPAAEVGDVADIVEGGGDLADALTPWTRPSAVEQLALYGD